MTEDHTEHVALDLARFVLWREAAERLGEAGAALRMELADVARDPSRHMLMRAARAARYAERITAGRDQQIANAVATEIENAASAGLT